MIIDDNFEIVFNFKSAGVTRAYKVAELPQESVLALLQYGTRKGNDFVNSAAAADQTKDKRTLALEWLERLEKGELGTAARDHTDAAFKAFVVQTLKANGEQAKALKGLSLEQLLEIAAKKVGKEPMEIHDVLFDKYLDIQEAIKAATKAFTL